MSLPKEPRQKMINMMYLVLTALLALNVSSEILNAFKTVDKSLMTATGVAEKKNSEIFKSFQKKIEDPTTREKAEIWLPKAQTAKKLSDEVYNYIEALKAELKKESGLKMVDGKEDFKEDDLDAATRLFVSAPPSGKGKGKELFDKLANFKKQLLEIDPEMAAAIGTNLPLDLPAVKSEKDKEEWAYTFFHMTPTVAGITMLSKFQNDIKNSESQAVEFCHKEIGQVELVYDQFQAIANANASYVMPGEEIIINAGVGAFNSASQPRVTVDGASATPTPDGSFEYKFRPSGTGSKNVTISFVKPDGTTASVTKEIKYTVGVPSGLVVSTDKTRVFYQGLENPLSVTGGSGDEKVNVSIEGAGIGFRKEGPGQYIVTASALGSATVNATDGKNTQKIVIPIKRVPNPLATVGGKGGGPIVANAFRVQRGVVADLKDFVFEGVKYEVVSFTLICTGRGFEESGFGIAEVSGAYFNAEAKALLNKCQAGSTVVIDEIKVSGPGGTRLLDQNISFTLQ
ncbi:gliding motility protein GldM [Sediminibacterium sp.]|uniref:type IX secretion system motor protein PorM/GldM n=1 Tax=Sediminibacterium sp. TaxID=1917865 RepID=UPI002736E97B|nr:gliding motility protein GldM [Sediminibacterium sp.]MDP3392365.1 gliding motility protein GldM [Sediminibacterium sp.]MDP3566833.1 gliding motility protein GldM [Sediminibacterium sp.]